MPGHAQRPRPGARAQRQALLYAYGMAGMVTSAWLDLASEHAHAEVLQSLYGSWWTREESGLDAVRLMPRQLHNSANGAQASASQLRAVLSAILRSAPAEGGHGQDGVSAGWHSLPFQPSNHGARCPRIADSPSQGAAPCGAWELLQTPAELRRHAGADSPAVIEAYAAHIGNRQGQLVTTAG